MSQPCSEYLISPEEFFLYLADKVGQGNMCLVCNYKGKAFYSLQVFFNLEKKICDISSRNIFSFRLFVIICWKKVIVTSMFKAKMLWSTLNFTIFLNQIRNPNFWGKKSYKNICGKMSPRKALKKLKHVCDVCVEYELRLSFVLYNSA